MPNLEIKNRESFICQDKKELLPSEKKKKKRTPKKKKKKKKKTRKKNPGKLNTPFVYNILVLNLNFKTFQSLL